MAKPLPVDVVTSTWDIIGVIANVVAGVGAAGALPGGRQSHVEWSLSCGDTRPR